jgi:hypothetical protein
VNFEQQPTFEKHQKFNKGINFRVGTTSTKKLVIVLGLDTPILCLRFRLLKKNHPFSNFFGILGKIIF